MLDAAIKLLGDRNMICVQQHTKWTLCEKGIAIPCFVDTPFQEQSVTPHMGIAAKTGGYVFPVKEFVSYELQWQLLEAGTRAAVERAGTRDVVRLAFGSYPVFCRYHDCYQEALKENAWGSFLP